MLLLIPLLFLLRSQSLEQVIQFPRVSFSDHFPSLQHHSSVAQFDVGDLVADQQNQLVLALQLEDAVVEDPATHHCVDGRDRVVQQVDVSVGVESAGEREPGLLPT